MSSAKIFLALVALAPCLFAAREVRTCRKAGVPGYRLNALVAALNFFNGIFILTVALL